MIFHSLESVFKCWTLKILSSYYLPKFQQKSEIFVYPNQQDTCSHRETQLILI